MILLLISSFSSSSSSSSSIPSDSNLNLFNMVTQLPFLSSLLEKLKSPDQSAALLCELEQIKQVLTSPASLRIFVAGNLTKLSASDLVEPWRGFPDLPPSSPPQ